MSLMENRTFMPGSYMIPSRESQQTVDMKEKEILSHIVPRTDTYVENMPG